MCLWYSVNVYSYSEDPHIYQSEKILIFHCQWKCSYSSVSQPLKLENQSIIFDKLLSLKFTMKELKMMPSSSNVLIEEDSFKIISIPFLTVPVQLFERIAIFNLLKSYFLTILNRQLSSQVKIFNYAHIKTRDQQISLRGLNSFELVIKDLVVFRSEVFFARKFEDQIHEKVIILSASNLTIFQFSLQI